MFIITSIILVLTVFQDIKERLVDGVYWIILLVLAIPVNLIRILLYWDKIEVLGFALLSIFIGISIALIMGYFGLWGGADVLALICIALLSPLSLEQINGFNLTLIQNDIFILLPLTLTLVINASLLQLPLPFIILSKNILNFRSNPDKYINPEGSRYKKLVASFIGEPLLVNQILKKPIWYFQVLEKNYNFDNTTDLNSIYPVPFIRFQSEPLQRWSMYSKFSWSMIQNSNYINKVTYPPFRRNLGWKFDFSIGMKSEEEDLFRQRTIISDAIDERRRYLWVQYSVPFLLPMTIGYLLAFFQINLLGELMKLFKMF